MRSKKKQNKIKYICNKCGYETLTWLGKCPDCKTFNSFIEQVTDYSYTKKISSGHGKPMKLDEISYQTDKYSSTDISELDRVLGGGIVSGSLVLLGGEPGTGKSTLFLQMLQNIKEKSVYITGEESLSQVKIRAERLNVKNENIFLLSETNVENIIETIKKEKPYIVIIDSIQTIFHPEIPSVPGSITQIRECALKFLEYGKKTDTCFFIIGHITKSGDIAGPKVLEHMVDTVMYFEGDKNNNFRILRTIKNRFGSTNEIGIFEMDSLGLKPIKNPSGLFIQKQENPAPGTAIAAVVEGTRTLLIEIQALTVSANYGTARRIVKGCDYKKISVLLAIIENQCRLNLITKDVFINIVGGIEISEPASDMAVVVSIISTLIKKNIPPDIVFIGELGLIGEIRNVTKISDRINEVKRLGYKKCVIPKNSNVKSDKEVEIIKVGTVKELFKYIKDL